MHFKHGPFAIADSQALNYMFDLMEVIKLSSAEPYRRLLSLRALRAAIKGGVKGKQRCGQLLWPYC